MLQIKVPLSEAYDDSTKEFVVADGFILELEHSLVSLSKWECEWEIPFLGDKEKTSEQTLSYIEMMIQTENPPEGILQKLSAHNLEEINTYINSKMTATWFSEPTTPKSREVVTAEIIYYWMIALQVPFECQNWHLNRLLTLIKVCNLKNAPPNKAASGASASDRRAMNDQRRRELGTRG